MTARKRPSSRRLDQPDQAGGEESTRPRKDAVGPPYSPPESVTVTGLTDLLRSRRSIVPEQQTRLEFVDGAGGIRLWCSGDVALVQNPAVAIVGTRSVSTEGAARARRLARELAEHGVVVVSGLARGVD